MDCSLKNQQIIIKNLYAENLYGLVYVSSNDPKYYSDL
jgi:hypothetical protein